ncbi:UDP-N-acetylglucosamine--N-acetylmuramyl-(pentapeptide) pyrophosphoryl-undecaprenol N-acetylglucosamine transferase [uncultured Campylobacter sp.]|uniref:UDP-N-acetylglucosamine--N-acetylmuramyl- (pentapeptide) pyrophosphoryl-undecaprenol N-acetylglucosamine transferase n=1 Tax=uncultured Campylobacter sp. TaxID=218934 RepID=UPI00260C73E7|nr:UDP-N-acetylglucosamine--N-acetylmuramyl-(pentapeptide) pyrophosphoryl-undecaprenol N-acetylglucosamine transferase [uncultured Campylobacter sp.]
MIIAITGGGTGGHLSIAKSLAISANKLGIECIYIGSTSGQDMAWFEKEKLFSHKYFLESTGVVNQKGLKKILSFLNILKLSIKAKKILNKHEIKDVFSVGGYSAAAASFATIFSNKNLFIHEQNSKKGFLNSLLKPFCKEFFSSFEETFCSYPVNENFFKKARIRKELKTVIFLGGSQGAKFINDLALKIATKLDEKGVKIIHQCGKNEYERCKAYYENLGIEVDLFDFHKQLDEKITQADLAIARAGASSLFELCANNLPCIFIPYPYASKNHQYFNAKFLLDKALCQIFTQDELQDEKKLLNSIFLVNLELISSGLKDIIKEDGADFIIKKALKKA